MDHFAVESDHPVQPVDTESQGDARMALAKEEKANLAR